MSPSSQHSRVQTQTSQASLPLALYSADGVRNLDRYLIDQQGISGFQLMQSAARSAFHYLLKRWPQARTVLVLCGAGNNAGDGYLLAKFAVQHGLEVKCLALTEPSRLQGDARTAWQQASAQQLQISLAMQLTDTELAAWLQHADVTVDAMLGTGLQGAARDPFAQVIALCNQSARRVLALDVPSGLNASSGAAAGEVVRADATVTFIGLKAGLLTGQGPAVCGELLFEDLGTAAQLKKCSEPLLATRADWHSCSVLMPRRVANAHKGHFGHILVVAGDHGFGGAALLVAEAAARSGAGLVSLATRPEHVTAALSRCPSVMSHGVMQGSELAPLLAAATIIVCGPGLGQGAWGRQMLQQVLSSNKPQVLDADALNLMAGEVSMAAEQRILTPHPGEAARLLGVSVADIEADRLSAAAQLQSQYGGNIVLKGAGTVIAGASGQLSLISGSNPGMACGGMGDVLAGILAGLWGQIADPEQVAISAVALHLAAANRAAEQFGFMSLQPTDLINSLPKVLADAGL